MGNQNGTDSSRRELLLWRFAPSVFGACAVAMILSLPLFPSQDGPVHLYYADILRGVLTHSGPYAQHFEIKSYVTPYVVLYYSLLALETVLPPLISEQLLVCGYVLTFILGFQYLVGALTDRPGPWPLVGAAFSLNFYLYMGLYSYLLATALSLLLSGYWLRSAKHLTPRRIAALTFGYVLLLLCHPVPAAIFLAFCGLHILVSFTYEYLASPGQIQACWRSFRRPLSVVMVMGVAGAGFVSRFLASMPRASTAGTETSIRLLDNVGAELKLWSLSPLGSIAYRLVLLALIASAGATLLIGLRRRREPIGAAAASVAGMAVVCLIARCATPFSLNNGGAFFQQRFSIYWVMFLFAFCSVLKPPRWFVNTIGVVALGCTATVLCFQWTYLSATARNLNSALAEPLVAPGSLGVVVSETDYVRREAVGDPFLGGSAHFFRNSKAIMTSAAWMDEPFIMLRPKHEYPWTYSSTSLASKKLLAVSRTDAASVKLDFIILVNGEGPITREMIGRLGFRTSNAGRKVAFYYHP
jgi:hypothetical protein